MSNEKIVNDNSINSSKAKVTFQNHKTTGNRPVPMDHEDEIFYFFYDIAEKMILKRSDAGDICTLSNWLKALERNKSKTVRNDYIKLMMMALQYPEPMCPFKDYPPEPIDPLENEVYEMAKRFVNREGTATCVGQNELETEVYNPSVATAVSHDKCQYASCQVIPNVGVQCYFAYSDDPIYYWSLPSQITVPERGPHATDLDWERATAGIVAEEVSESVENLLKTMSRNNRPEEEVMSYAASSKFFKKKDKENDGLELCKVMHVEQKNRNVSEHFVWNDGSLLTREIVLGAEECSDRKIDSQVNTQPAIDKDAANVHERLYPGDFKINVDTSVMQEIFPTRNDTGSGADKDNEKKRKTNGQSPSDDGSKNRRDGHRKSRGCGPADTADDGNVRRQSAGEETAAGVGLPCGRVRDDRTADKSNKNSHHCRATTEMSAVDFVAAMRAAGLKKRCEDRQQQTTGPTRYDRSERQRNAAGSSSYETPSSADDRRTINVVRESLAESLPPHSSLSRNKRNGNGCVQQKK